MIRALLAAAFLATAAQAQELPALYDVYDVASDDVLNVRAGRSGSSDIIGALTPNAKNIEVVRSQDGWALVNFGEQAGWVWMRYLKAAVEQPLHGYPAQCFGAEPFWSLTNGSEMVFKLAGETPINFAPVGGGTASGWSGKSYTLGVNGPSQLTAIITRESCNDGMSDRQFGLSTDIVLQTSTGAALYSGCCLLR